MLNDCLYGPKVKVQNTLARLTISQNIPPKLVQTWESNRIRLLFFASIMKFRKLNPDLDFILFDRFQRDLYMEENWKETPILELYKASRFGQLSADIFRYCYIFDNGGYYFDISKALDVQLTTLHRRESEAIFSFEKNPAPQNLTPIIEPNRWDNNNLVIQWGFGFRPKHPFLKQLIERIEVDGAKYRGVIFPSPKLAILQLTGPVQFTNVLRGFSNSHPADFAKMEQLGIDFAGHGILSLLGSGSRYEESPNYAKCANQSILDDCT